MTEVAPTGQGRPWRRHAHRAYLAGVGFKGIHGVGDVLTALVLLVAPHLLPTGVLWMATETGDDLGAAGPAVSGALRYVGTDLLTWPAGLLGVFLLVHGLVKLASAVCLLRRLVRGYPWAIGALVALLVYQVVDAAVTASLTMAGLAVVDVAVIVLVVAEYRHLRAELREQAGQDRRDAEQPRAAALARR
jgi:uncharacterized membrane protein